MIERVWLFVEKALGSPKALNRQIEIIDDLQVTDVAIFVNGNKTCDFRLSETRAENTRILCQKLHKLKIDTHLVTWLHPNKNYISNCAASLRPLCESTNARSLIFDAEDAWKDGEKYICVKKEEGNCLRKGTEKCNKSLPKKGKGMTEHIKTMTNDENWKPFFNWPCPLGVTDIANIGGYSKRRLQPLIKRCFYILPQPQATTKSMFKKKFEATQKSWGGFFNVYPGFTPRIQPKPTIMVITARNRTSIETMQYAIEKVENSKDPKITEVAYWSYNNLKDSKIPNNQKAREKRRAFIRDVSRKARAGIPQSQSIDVDDHIRHLTIKL